MNAKEIAAKIEYTARGKGYKTPSGDLVELIDIRPVGGRMVFSYDDGAVSGKLYQKYELSEFLEKLWYNEIPNCDQVWINTIQGSIHDDKDLVTLSDVAYNALCQACDEIGGVC